MECINIFDVKFADIIKNSVKAVQLETSQHSESKNTSIEDWNSKKQDILSCSYCRIEFPNSQLQREHYKLDWHRYNLKQSLLCRQPITETEFVDRTGRDDLSSISGSESDKEDTLDSYATAQGKIFLQSDEDVFSMYRCLLFDRKEEITESVLLKRLKQCCENKKQWTILMLGGGHFAGAVFQGNSVILHKTFHCYTVRAGQGGSQSSRDNKSGGSHAKSAGASLRRYNEQALVQHVRNIVEAWKPEIAKSDLIIYRASGPYNRGVLFGNNLIDRSDKKLRTIPFSTRRATFTEVKRVHSLLSTVEVYKSLDFATECLKKQKSPEQEAKRNKIRSSCINRAKSREIVERPLPCKTSTNTSESDVVDYKETVQESVLYANDKEINFRHSLKQFDDTLTPEQRKKTHKKKPRKSKAKKEREFEESRKKELFDVLFKGNLDSLKKLLDNHINSISNQNGDEENKNQDRLNDNEIKSKFVNEILEDNGNTLLHITAMNEHVEVLNFLLNNEANPCLKNKNQHTAYTCTQSKEIREALKQFAKENPHKFNYNKANIPISDLTEEELLEKKKVQRKLKREKEKEKKKENEIKKKEEIEKTRFLQLSDREKRALAAERRILSQSGTVTARCFLCASDMSGKVPFEYMGNRFCTMECLKSHRMKNSMIV